MARGPSEIAVQQTSTPIAQRKQPRRPFRRSARLEEAQQKRSEGTSKDRERDCDSLEANTAGTLQSNLRKRSRTHEEIDEQSPEVEPCKRARVSVPGAAIDEASYQRATSIGSEDNRNPIVYWTWHSRWPKEYFEQDDETREYLNRDLEAESWFQEHWLPNMSHCLARKRSSASLLRNQSESSLNTPRSTTPSDQKPRAAKSTPYHHARYETLLSTKASFMDKDKEGLKNESKALQRTLLEAPQNVPEKSRFSDDIFESTCRRMQGRNEDKVIQDISRLIVPSAEDLADFGADNLNCLIESVNEGWNNSIAVTKPRPQPDYAVGFRRSGFTNDQIHKLEPFVGDLSDVSYFMATYYMYFPFLTCEVKCGAAALDIADRQNAHSMTMAVRAIVELFRLVKREKEVNREMLAFSISHDHRTVRIYGHYAVIDGSNTAYYRHPIRTFDFTELDGKEKWTAYKFTRNVYDIWMPAHFQMICSAIDQIPPDVNFELSQSELQFPDGSGLSQDLGEYSIAQSSSGSKSVQAEVDNQSSVVHNQTSTPNTFVSGGVFKKPRACSGKMTNKDNHNDT